MIHEDKTCITSVYRKPTFSGINAHFESFLPCTYKFHTVHILTQMLPDILKLE